MRVLSQSGRLYRRLYKEARRKGEQIFALDLFYDKTVVKSSGVEVFPWYLINNHLPADAASRPDEVEVLALCHVGRKYDDPTERKAEPAVRGRAELHRRMSEVILEPFMEEAGLAGCQARLIDGTMVILQKTVTGVRLDHPELMASAKTLWCARCRICGQARYGKYSAHHRARRRDGTEERRLIAAALATQERARSARSALARAHADVAQAKALHPKAARKPAVQAARLACKAAKAAKRAAETAEKALKAACRKIGLHARGMPLSKLARCTNAYAPRKAAAPR